MDLCLMIEGQEGVTWPQWLELARACEANGVPALFRSDHYMNLDGGHPERIALDAWATLSALAAATSTVRLGTMVSPATFRHPSVVAKMVATVDQISGGRVDLGLGAGWHEREHAAYGFPFPATRERMDILEEQLQVILGSWQESPFSFTGAHYRLDGLDARPKPVQQPHPPVIMGGAAGPRSAALAARYASEYNTTFPTLEQVRERKARIDAACEKAGRQGIPFSIMTAVIAGSDEADLRARVERVARRRGDDPEAMLGHPPAGWVIGTIERASEQLAALRDAGVARVLCQHLAHDDLEFVALLGRELAQRVG